MMGADRLSEYFQHRGLLHLASWSTKLQLTGRAFGPTLSHNQLLALLDTRILLLGYYLCIFIIMTNRCNSGVTILIRLASVALARHRLAGGYLADNQG